jgi:hypothetical protein
MLVKNPAFTDSSGVMFGTTRSTGLYFSYFNRLKNLQLSHNSMIINVWCERGLPQNPQVFFRDVPGPFQI